MVTKRQVININANKVLEFAGLAGELLLKNGAETSRVEDTINRICKKAGLEDTEVVVFPTGIIIYGNKEEAGLTLAKRVKARDINLSVVSVVNDISRKFADGKLSLEDGLSMTQDLHINPPGSHYLSSLIAGALASGASTILLGGLFTDVLPAITAAALVRGAIGVVSFNLAYILQLYAAGLLAGTVGSFFVDLNFGQHLDKIIVGALLPLVPGVALTNSVRDFISGDLLSGTMRLVEAVLIAAALAGGVGFALAAYAGYLRPLVF